MDDRQATFVPTVHSDVRTECSLGNVRSPAAELDGIETKSAVQSRQRRGEHGRQSSISGGRLRLSRLSVQKPLYRPLRPSERPLLMLCTLPSCGQLTLRMS